MPNTGPQVHIPDFLKPKQPTITRGDLFSTFDAAPDAEEEMSKPAGVHVPDFLKDPKLTHSTTRQVLQNILEVPKQLPSGAAQAVGTKMAAVATMPYDKITNELSFMKRVGERGYRDLTPEEQAVARRAVRGNHRVSYYVFKASPEERQQMIAEREAKFAEYEEDPVQDSWLFKAGQDVAETELFEPAPGYRGEPGDVVGKGLGQLLTEVAISRVNPALGAASMTLSGQGEAAMRAAKAGATNEQILVAGDWGRLAGVTDMVPVETLLGRIPIKGLQVPGQYIGPLIRGVSRVGMQAFIEGVQEMGQEYIHNLIAKNIYAPDQDPYKDILQAGEAGGMVGAAAQFGKELLTLPGRRRASNAGQYDVTPEEMDAATFGVTEEDRGFEELLEETPEPAPEVVLPDGVQTFNQDVPVALADEDATFDDLLRETDAPDQYAIPETFTDNAAGMQDVDLEQNAAAISIMRRLEQRTGFTVAPDQVPEYLSLIQQGHTTPQAFAKVTEQQQMDGEFGPVIPDAPGDYGPQPVLDFNPEDYSRIWGVPVGEHNQPPAMTDEQVADRSAAELEALLGDGLEPSVPADNFVQSEQEALEIWADMQQKTGISIPDDQVPAYLAAVSQGQSAKEAFIDYAEQAAVQQEQELVEILLQERAERAEMGDIYEVDPDTAFDLGVEHAIETSRPEQTGEISQEIETVEAAAENETLGIGENTAALTEIQDFERGSFEDLNALRAGNIPQIRERTQPITSRIIREGGIDPESPLASEFRAMDVRRPGFFVSGGASSLDGFVIGEDPLLSNAFPGRADQVLDENEVIELVRAELGGDYMKDPSDNMEFDGKRAARLGEMSDAAEALGVDFSVLTNTEAQAIMSLATSPDDVPALMTQVMQRRADKDPDDIQARLSVANGRFPSLSYDRLMPKRDARQAVRTYTTTLNKRKVTFKNKLEAALYMVSSSRRPDSAAAKAGRQYLRDQGLHDRDIDALSQDATKKVREYFKGARKRGAITSVPAGQVAPFLAKQDVTEAKAPTQETPKAPDPEPVESTVSQAEFSVDEEGRVNGSAVSDQKDVEAIGKAYDEGVTDVPFSIPGLRGDTQAQRATDLKAAVMAEADRMGLTDLVDSIRFEAYVTVGDQRVEGAYDRGENVIHVSLESGDGVHVLRHEGIHALRHMGAINEDEWVVLARQARKKWVDKHDIRERWGPILAGDPPGLAERKMVEEAIAEEFAAWRDGAKAGSAIEAIFKRIQAFLEALGNALRGRGFQTYQDVFRAIDNGELASRVVQPGTDTDVMAQAPKTPNSNYARPNNQRNGGHAFGPIYHEESMRISKVLGQGNATGLSALANTPAAIKKAAEIAAGSSNLRRKQAMEFAKLMALPVRRAIQDKFVDLKKAQQRIAERAGLAELPDYMDPYMAQELYHGKTGQKRIVFKEEYVHPMIDLMRERGVSSDELNGYAYLRHAQERNAQIAKINPKFPDGGSGVSNDEALNGVGSDRTDNKIMQMGLNGIPADKLADLEAVMQHFDRIMNARLDMLVSYGLETQAHVDHLRATYKHYVPLQGIDFDAENIERHRAEGGSVGSGTGFSIKGPEHKFALGRESLAEGNVIANGLSMTEGTIVRGEKNQVGHALLNLVLATPDPKYWNAFVNEKDGTQVTLRNGTIVNIPGKGKIDRRVETQDGVTVKEQVDGLYGQRDTDQVIFVKVGGREFGIHLLDTNLYRALTSHGAEPTNLALRAMNFVNRQQSLVNTGMNPEFILSNFFRDLQAAALHMSEAQFRDVQVQSLKDVKAAMGGLWKDGKRDHSTEWSKWAREFRMNGGQVTFADAHDLKTQIKMLDKIPVELKDGKHHAPMKAAKATIETIEAMNTVVENSTRLALYKNLRENGVSEKRAAHHALNLTVNFHRKGSMSPLLNAMYVFFNARVQGTYRELAAMKSSRVRRILYGVIGLGAMLDQWNAFMGGDDDDEGNAWDKIPAWEKQHNFILMVPSAVNEAVGLKPGFAVKIPMAYGMAPFFNLGRLLSSTARRQVSSYSDIDAGEGMRPLEAMGEMGSVMFNMFNFGGSSDSPETFVSPTVADPFWQLNANRDWRNAPIKPEQPPFGVPEPESQLSWRGTPEVYRFMAETMNTLTGGDEVEGGLLDISPEVLQFWWGFGTGGTGRFVENIGITAANTVQGEPTPLKNIPFGRKLVRSKPEFIDRGLFYERADAVRLVRKKIDDFPKLGKGDRIQDIRKEYRRLLSIEPRFESARKKLQNLSKRKKALRANGVDDTDYRMENIFKAEKRIIDNANRAFNRSGADKEL